MAQRFPGRPPGSSDFQRLASEFYDDDDSFWSLPAIQEQLQRPPHQKPTEDPQTMNCFPGRPPGSSDLQRLASEFFDDDDSFWSLSDIHQTEDPLTRDRFPGRPHLIPSQVYMKPSNRRKIDPKPCVSVSKPRIATASNPAWLHKDMYSENDIQHSCVPVCYRSPEPPCGPSVEYNMPPHSPVSSSPDLNPIPKTKSWRMPVPTSDNLALYAAYVPECYEMTCPSTESFFGLTANGIHNTDTTNVSPPAPAFRTSLATTTSYPLLKPSLSKDTCTTATTNL